MTVKSKKYSGILSKDILRVLIGDRSFEVQNTGEIATTFGMPYMKMADIKELGYKFGFNFTNEPEISSRFNYFEAIIKKAIDINKIEDVLTYLFQKQRFSQLWNQNLTATEFETDFSNQRNFILEKINQILYLSDSKLIFQNGRLFFVSNMSTVPLNLPKLKTIDHEYVTELVNRAYSDIERGEFDSAITKSKTLLEEVLTFGIEEKNEKAEDTGKIDVLLKHFKSLYKMHVVPSMDNRIKGLISGLDRIIFTISEMRNKDSDAHAAGKNRIKIKDYHARLFVNAAATMADFIVSVVINPKN